MGEGSECSRPFSCVTESKIWESTIHGSKDGHDLETLKFLMISTHYPPFNVGGDAVMVEYLAKELVKRGHEVHVYHNPAVYRALRNVSPAVDHLGTVDGVVLHPFSSRSGYLDLLLTLVFDKSGAARQRLKELVDELQPDVVHWHNTKGFIGVPFAVKNAITFYTAHDYSFVCPRSNLAKPDMSFCDSPSFCMLCASRWRKPPQIWRFGNRRVVRLPEEIKVLCPSEFMSRRLRQDGVKVFRVLNNFVPDPGPPIPMPASERDTLAYVAMLERHKGPLTLLEAFARSRNQHGFKLKIIGEGSMKRRLRLAAASLGISDRVSIPGFVSRQELENTLRKAAAIVIPSEWPETASLVAMEAFSLGLPAIATNQGGLPETLGNDSGSVMFKAGDVDELAALIVSHWKRRSEIGKLSIMARNAYENRFSPNIHISLYLNMIAELSSHAEVESVY